MKKLLLLFLISALAFNFVGCGNSNSKKEEKPKKELKQETVKEEVKEEPKEEVKETVKEEKKEELKEEKKEDKKKINTEIKQNTPKEATETYFSAWKNQDYKSMYKVAQPTWKKTNKEDLINAWYDFKTLKSFKIENENSNNMQIGDKELIMTKVTVKVTYEAIPGKEEKKTIVANAIKEDGKWWVNPTSTLKEN